MQVLVAEDDVVFRRILENMLVKWDYQVVSASDGQEAWNLLHGENSPQLVILDWMMPGLDGAEICSRLRKENQEPYKYVIMLTARDQRGDMLAGLEAGADDYIAKPFDPLELRARLRAGKRILDLQSELVSAREELRHQATHDPLTRLLNRSAILNALNFELYRSDRKHSTVAVVMADIDDFKRINDSHGHAAGDIVLCEIAHRMSSSVRIYDSIGRYGGEEFLIVLPDCDILSGASIAERIRAEICGQKIRLARAQITVTVSLGVAIAEATHNPDPDLLIQKADDALYRAKGAGRNRVVVAKTDEPYPALPAP